MLMLAVKALAEYIDSMNIDLFAFPIYADCLKPILVNADDFLQRVTEYAERGEIFPLLEMRTNEGYFRLRERYTATTILPLLKGLRTELTTPKKRYKRLQDLPHVRSIIARDFEIFVCECVDGIHYGDNIAKIDVVDKNGRQIECKKGKGIMAKQSTIK